MLLVRVTLPPGRRGGHLRRHDALLLVAQLRAQPALGAPEQRVREEDGVLAQPAVGVVGAEGRVVVDVPLLGGAGDDELGAAGGGGGGVEDGDGAGGGAGEDLVDFGVPVHGDEGVGGGDGEGLFGGEGREGEDVQVSGGVAG